MGESQLQMADGKINQLVLNQTKLQFEADALSLARDASQLANLARVMHLKQENQIGSAIVTNHMASHCVHGSGPLSYLNPYIDKVNVGKKK